MKTFNLNSDEWDGTRDRDGWRIRAALVGQRIGGELIGATMSEVEPGSKLWPYHTHYLNEEWVIVLHGEPTLRTPEGELRAFSARCPHLNCTVQYDSDQRQIVCACHGGVFDLNGKNIAGPPPKPLTAYNVNIRGDEVIVSRV